METAEEIRKANRRLDMTATDVYVEKIWERYVKGESADYDEFKQAIKVAMEDQRYASWILVMRKTDPTASRLAFTVRDTKINFDDIKFYLK